MPSVETCIEKPFADVRFKRHDATAKHAGLHGHTARKLCSCAQCCSRFDPTLERSNNAVMHGRELAQPYALSVFELEGLDTLHSLNRNQAWELVPDVLGQNSVGQPLARKLKDGSIETSFMLEPAALLIPEPATAAAVKRLATHIYRIHRHRPKLELVVPTEPPDKVNKPLLKAVLSSANRVPQTACVRCNDPCSYWDVSGAYGKPLDLDLRSTSLISAIGTQGRHPATRRYPTCQRSSETGRWVVEDAEHLVDYQTGTEYKGPHWRVRSTPEEPPYFRGGDQLRPTQGPLRP